MKNKKGFTLDNLLVILAVLGVLIAVFVPVFTSILDKAKESNTTTNNRATYASIIAEANNKATLSTNGVFYTTLCKCQCITPSGEYIVGYVPEEVIQTAHTTFQY